MLIIRSNNAIIIIIIIITIKNDGVLSVLFADNILKNQMTAVETNTMFLFRNILRI